jgi:hypothetical protein
LNLLALFVGREPQRVLDIVSGDHHLHMRQLPRLISRVSKPLPTRPEEKNVA